MLRSSLIVMSMLILACTSQAGTWRVEKDGTGDFQVIQDAVDVAASGDTIRIGVGRFDEAEEIVTPGWTKLTRVVLKQNTLTMIGVGDGQTIIGREEPFQLEAHGDDQGLISAPFWSSETVYLEGIQFENMEAAVVADQNTRVVMKNCSFVGNRNGILNFNGQHLEVYDCLFEGMGRDGFHLAAWSCLTVRILRSEFILPVDYSMAQECVGLTGIVEGTIEDCSFVNGWGGVIFMGVVISNSWTVNSTGKNTTGLRCVVTPAFTKCGIALFAICEMGYCSVQVQPAMRLSTRSSRTWLEHPYGLQILTLGSCVTVILPRERGVYSII